jgi:hypothetical protein
MIASFCPLILILPYAQNQSKRFFELLQISGIFSERLIFGTSRHQRTSCAAPGIVVSTTVRASTTSSFIANVNSPDMVGQPFARAPGT